MQRVTLEKILLEFDPEMRNLLPALRAIHLTFGYLTEKDAHKVADYFSCAFSKVYETATFYDLLKTKKPVALEIKVCSGADCKLGGGREVLSEVENYFKVKAGDKFNPKVKIEEVSCLGRCAEGPIVIINGKVYERVTKNLVHKILDQWI